MLNKKTIKEIKVKLEQERARNDRLRESLKISRKELHKPITI